MASPLRKILIEIISSSSKWKEEQITHSIYSSGGPENSQPKSPHPGLQIHIWLMLVFSRSRAQLPIHVLSSSLSLLIGKTIKPPCWNPLKRQVWKDGIRKQSMRTVAKQQFTQQGCLDKNLLTDNFSLTFVIKVHPFPTISGSQHWQSETWPNPKSPRGTQSQCLGRLTLLLRGSSSPRTLQCCKHSLGGSDRDKFHLFLDPQQIEEVCKYHSWGVLK